jgi:hypothetical protein
MSDRLLTSPSRSGQPLHPNNLYVGPQKSSGFVGLTHRSSSEPAGVLLSTTLPQQKRLSAGSDRFALSLKPTGSGALRHNSANIMDNALSQSATGIVGSGPVPAYTTVIGTSYSSIPLGQRQTVKQAANAYKRYFPGKNPGEFKTGLTFFKPFQDTSINLANAVRETGYGALQAKIDRIVNAGRGTIDNPRFNRLTDKAGQLQINRIDPARLLRDFAFIDYKKAWNAVF